MLNLSCEIHNVARKKLTLAVDLTNSFIRLDIVLSDTGTV